jgi:hypothetical protein
MRGADDYAILTGICWYPAGQFTPLNGPPNDIELVEKWLQECGVPGASIKKVATPAPVPTDFDPYAARPVGDDFDREFRRMLDARMGMGADRVKGRLYLYFSGHGFSSKTQDRDAEAALYCANATRVAYEHIFGTHYARIAKAWALFAEVILIMDCCRDSESVRTPTPRPYRDTPEDDLAPDIPLLSIYAVPKGGKAQEREIPERDRKVHGLLTHALFKLLDELPPTSGKGIEATELKAKLLEAWNDICGHDAAPRPEVYLPANGRIYLQTKSEGSAVTFFWEGVPPPGMLELIDSDGKIVGSFALDGSGVAHTVVDGPVLRHTCKPGEWLLRLAPGLYEYKYAQKPPQSFRVAGGDNRVQL